LQGCDSNRDLIVVESGTAEGEWKTLITEHSPRGR